ncbi:ABC transporter permease [Microbacterium horticulturae]|uniref:ABC transporter permease n=1 Tax=Microbacterium horticulturae TaxID=3028316 RepID=A0ABY8C075_9MICO|nr:ABC transporter permease [Microbacterium sp. KACC 23027]WEG09650.1 ABC transporter permease [Microbacterium sp. KACC 23027]
MTALAPPAPAPTPAPPSNLRHRVRRNPAPYLLALAGAAWLLVLFVIPLISGLAVSLMTGNPQEGYTFTWNWGVYGQLFGPGASTPYWLFLGRGVFYGAMATIVTILVGYPMAYFIAFRARPEWKNALLLLVMLSFLVSFIIRTDMWAFLLSDQGPVLSMLRGIHLVGKDFHILGTDAAVIGGLAYNDLAFMVLPIYVALERIDPRLIEASADLYGRKPATFFHTVLPLTRSGIFAGILLVFIDSAGDPVSPSLLGGTHTYTIGQAIQDAYLTNQQYNVAAALSTVLMIVLGVILFAYARIAGTDNIEDLV